MLRPGGSADIQLKRHFNNLIKPINRVFCGLSVLFFVLRHGGRGTGVRVLAGGGGSCCIDCPKRDDGIASAVARAAPHKGLVRGRETGYNM